MDFKSKFKGYLFEVQFTQYGKDYKIDVVAKNEHNVRQKIKLHYPYSHINDITCVKILSDI